jgi:hypothetical protein
MKRKITNVSYRKESNTFPDWLKYEITIMNQDGTEELIPAYGKDLEDAISRVKHDERVEKIEKNTRRIPPFVFLISWVLYMLGVVSLQIRFDEPLIIVYGLIFAGFTIIFFQWWLQYRNVDKN